MPSPIGHALAGVAVALAADRQAGQGGLKWFLTRPLTILAVALATLPDADLLLSGLHRTVTHSLGGTAFVTIVAIVVTGWVRRQPAVSSQQSAVGSQKSAVSSQTSAVSSRESGVGSRRLVWIVALVCSAAHASHLLTDWLGADFSQPSGIQLLWPFSDRWYISGWDIFPRIERRQILSATSLAINARAVAWEIGIMAPLVALAWWWRRRSRTASRHPCQA